MHKATTVVVLAVAATSLAWPQNKEVRIAAIDELRSARTAYALQVGQQEAKQIISAVGPLRKSQAEFATWAADQWKTSGDKLKAAIKAWAAGQQPSQDDAQAAQELLKAAAEKLAKLRDAAAEAAIGARTALGDRAVLVETAEQAEARRLAERRFSGARNAAEAVLSAAESLRLLMPDDYELVRVAEAERLADAIAGRTAPPDLVSAVLGVLDQLVDMPPQRFVADRDRLLAFIAHQLNLPPQDAAIPPVSWDDFVDWLRSPQTATVLATIAGEAPPTNVEPPAEFTTALAQLRVLWLPVDLMMRPGQIRAFAQLVTQIAADVEQARRDRDALQQQALQVLPAVRDALKSGKALEGEVADQVQQILANDDEIQASLKLAMVGYLRQLRRLLAPPQRQLVDWVPPGEVLRLVPVQAKVQRLRERAALIQQALDFLNRLKYQTAKRYMNLKVSQSQQFVAAFIPPDSPDYDRAMDFVLELVTEARMVPREDWEGGADVEFATRLMRGLGVLREAVPPPPTGRELYTWESLYEIFTAPGAAAVFQTQGAE